VIETRRFRPSVRSNRNFYIYAERSISKLLADLGFVHISVRPRHPAQDATVVEAFKKTSRAHLRHM